VADPVTFSVWGTFPSWNEPDKNFTGVVQAPLSSVFTATNALSTKTFELTPLGTVHILPQEPFPPSGPIPDFYNAPFDFHVEFVNEPSLPSLEIKGVMAGGISYDGPLGVNPFAPITSITSSAPEFNANLPAPFIDMIEHPDRVSIGLNVTDWSITELPVYAIYSPNVPEPATCAVMVAGFLGLAWRRRRRAGVA